MADGLRVQLQHAHDPVSLALQSDRSRILEVFRDAISQSSPASSLALPTMQEAMKPQKHAVLVQDENQLLENALRLLLQELVGAAVDAGEPIMQYGRSIDDSDSSGGLITKLLDILLYLCEKSHVEGGMVFQLLEDLTEVSTIKDCKEVFAYIEGKQEVLGKTELFGRGKLVMLRTCNQLLRRLSKANDVVFCGRILMFLAHVFPLYERSAVNIKGVFNTSNETNYEKDQPDDVPIDINFYKTFWGLQEHFSNPAALIQRWQTFSTSLNVVLNAFDAQPLGDDDGSAHHLDEGDDMTFNTKYLTSSNLMSLELKDPSFRRHVLVQCLIVFDYLKTPGKTEKEAARESLKDDVKVAEDRVKHLLESTPPKGKQFLKSIEHLLEREKNWVWWKRDGCPAFEKNSMERKSSGEGTKKRKQRWRLGNKELSQLWKWADQNPNALTDPQRIRTPPIHEYWTALAEDMDPASGIEAEYSHKNDRVYCWKGLRFTARQELEGFARFTELGIEGVVPPELLTPEVRLRIHGKLDKSKQKVAKKGDETAMVPPAEENQNGSVAVDDGGATQDVDDAIPMDSDAAAAKEEESQDDLERPGSDHEPLEGFPSTQDTFPDAAAADNDSPRARSPGDGHRYFKKHSHSHPEGS